MQNIQKAVEEDNLKAFSEFKLSIEDLLGLRLKHNLNILQATSYFGAEVILKYLANFLILDEEAKKELIDYRGAESSDYRISRGNSWYDTVDYMPLTIRNGNYPDHSMHNLGFRLVLEAPKE